MNKNRVKGTADEIIGTAKRKIGQLTGDSDSWLKASHA